MPTPSSPRPLLSLHLKTRDGSVTLRIPRSFRGQLTLYTHDGRILLSPEVSARAAPLSGVGKHTYFVGERPKANVWRTGDDGADGEEEQVDDAHCETHDGRVTVKYEDEVDPKRLGMWGTLVRAWKEEVLASF